MSIPKKGLVVMRSCSCYLAVAIANHARLLRWPLTSCTLESSAQQQTPSRVCSYSRTGVSNIDTAGVHMRQCVVTCAKHTGHCLLVSVREVTLMGALRFFFVCAVAAQLGPVYTKPFQARSSNPRHLGGKLLFTPKNHIQLLLSYAAPQLR